MLHSIFASLHTSVRLAGECEGLVSRLRSMSDLDVTLAQAESAEQPFLSSSTVPGMAAG